VYGRRNTASASAPPAGSAHAELEGKAAEFVRALGAFARTTSAPAILCFCPPPEAHHGANAVSTPDLLALENRLLEQVRSLPNVYAVGSAEIRSRYPGTEFHDAHSDKLGHIPFTPEGFAAIGSSAFRVFAGLRSAPYKVIVLDCDNTLWRGACGEEGATGVAVTPAFAALQEFMIAQAAAGMLICLCSKNTADDVWAVFDRNSGMKLARTHLAASRINWEPKSKNLHALAAELNVGLDSFIFLDDNPVECAEVQASCPAVLTLQLPADPDNFASFLSHVWAFDHLRVTDEDRSRTQKMRENAQREQYRGEASTLKDFIAGLQLEVTIAEPTADQLPRVAQLTQRTNQFNFTTVRRTENDLVRFFDQEAGRALAISVRDRFGDYGMVGLLLYRSAGDRYEIDTFLLSCRVLGRGVEHQVLARLGALAAADKKAWIDLPYSATDKNQPASDFVKALKAEQTSAQGDRTVYRFASQALAGLRYEPAAAAVGPEITEEKSSRRPAVGAGKLAAKLPLIARNLASSRELHAAIENHRLRASGFNGTAADPELPATLDGHLLGIWRRVIGNPHLGMNDNFFDAGGTSLKAVQTVAAIRRELNLQLSIVNIFERPTVRLLHEKLVPDEAAEDRADEAMERGAKRKQRMRKRE
jgi:FkbH-like protein